MSEPPVETAPPGDIDYIAVEESRAIPRAQAQAPPLRLPAHGRSSSSGTSRTCSCRRSRRSSCRSGCAAYITFGLLLGLGQFVTTFVITMWYVWYANHRIDPISSEIRDDLEKPERRS